MKYTSVQKRILKEAEEAEQKLATPSDPDAPIEGKIKTNTEVDLPKQETENIDSLIKATEMLQKVAADLDSIKFLVEQDLSDFSMGKKIEAFKWETIKFITKLKEKIYHSASADPSAKSKIAAWLGL